jgi:hypothetical protein
MSSRFWVTFGVIKPSDGTGLAGDTPLASDNDNPAAPKTGIVLLRRFPFDARFTALTAFKPLTSVCLAIVRPCASSRNVPTVIDVPIANRKAPTCGAIERGVFRRAKGS